jgi:uncharacterized protein YecT (DUF1311 family)
MFMRKLHSNLLLLAGLLMAAFTPTACAPAGAPALPGTESVEVTRIPGPSPTPVIVEVTRVVTLLAADPGLVEPAATDPAPAGSAPNGASETPSPAAECYTRAITQLEMNACAVAEYEQAIAALDEAAAALTLAEADRALLEGIQQEWQAQVERDCSFFFGQTDTAADGTVIYRNGSMAPLLVLGCQIRRAEQRLEELRGLEDWLRGEG